MAWTIAKLTTLHRTIKPELLEQPNQLLTAEATDLGDADTTPDNLYMIGTFRLDEGESLVLDIDPPESRYWSVTLENIWHECIDARRRRSSITNAGAVSDGSGKVRIVISAQSDGSANWLDTGGRHRGFMILRWLDNPAPPSVERASFGRRTLVSDRLNRDRLVGEAIERAGSDDFGEATWAEGLDRLLDSLTNEARLHDIGVEVAANDVVTALTNRLGITAWRTAHPDVAHQDVTRPIVIIGQPRTGTTILFDLLAQDPGCARR